MTTMEEMHGFLRGEKRPAPPIDEAQIAELREIADRYRRPCPFEVGDLVMPRANSPIFPKDRPWLVVSVRVHAPYVFGGNEAPSSMAFGNKVDFRAIVLSGHDNGSYVAFWNESWQFEPYVAKTA